MKILQWISAIILSGFVICVAYAQPPVDFQGMQQRYQQMQALMNRAQTSQNPSERYDLMLQHSQLMQQQMQSMNGMMGGYGPGGSMMGGTMGGGMMGQGGVNRGYPQGATIQEQLNMMNDRINLMQQMMEQMLEQQRLMLPPKK